MEFFTNQIEYEKENVKYFMVGGGDAGVGRGVLIYKRNNRNVGWENTKYTILMNF